MILNNKNSQCQQCKIGYYLGAEMECLSNKDPYTKSIWWLVLIGIGLIIVAVVIKKLTGGKKDELEETYIAVD